MGRLTKWCESLQEWQENHDNDERKGFKNGSRACMTRLGEYEDAEEQGLLVRLPCKVGDTVYEANKRGFISTYKIISVHFSNCSTLIGWTLIDGEYSNLNGFELLALGKTVFLTKEDAEKALAEMGNEL